MISRFRKNPFLPVNLLMAVLLTCVFFSRDLSAANEKKITDYKGVYLDLGGKKVKAATRGRVLFLNFWASWCAPCLFEIPVINRLKDKYGEKVDFVGISLDDMEPAKVGIFVRKYKIQYKVGVATKGLAEEFKVTSVPATFIFKADGGFHKRLDGPQKSEVFEAEILAALSGS